MGFTVGCPFLGMQEREWCMWIVDKEEISFPKIMFHGPQVV